MTFSVDYSYHTHPADHPLNESSIKDFVTDKKNTHNSCVSTTQNNKLGDITIQTLEILNTVCDNNQ